MSVSKKQIDHIISLKPHGTAQMERYKQENQQVCKDYAVRNFLIDQDYKLVFDLKVLE